jgi:hypothetical protein
MAALRGGKKGSAHSEPPDRQSLAELFHADPEKDTARELMEP